ncbi:hypothetical protein Ciccas_008975 [Cichlidogyrus casuarinus]|uniref:Uncharacterized protein n=1 Tax=Cichlidogyrus casuarinus TaxID=1844966 RepID=A0ABD2PYD4_9PLAT
MFSTPHAELTWETDLSVFLKRNWAQPSAESKKHGPIVEFELGKNPFPRKEPSTLNYRGMKGTSLEFCNLALALLVLSCWYPSVFWYTSRSFSLVFAGLLLLGSVHVMCEYCVAEILVKLGWNPRIRQKFTSTLLGAKMSATNHSKDDMFEKLKLPELPMGQAFFMLVSSTSNLLLLSLFMIVFEYGYRQIGENLISYQNFLQATDKSADNLPESETLFRQTSLTSKPSSIFPQVHRTHCCLTTRMACFFAALCTVMVALIKFPLIWTAVEVYQATRNILIFWYFIVSGVFFFVWLVAWFAFALKPSCKFKVSQQQLW